MRGEDGVAAVGAVDGGDYGSCAFVVIVVVLSVAGK